MPTTTNRCKRIDTIHAQLFQSTMMSYEICGGNHSSDHCTFNHNPGWQNRQNFTWYNNEGPTDPTESLYSFYSSQALEFPQDSKPYAEDMLMQLVNQQEENLRNTARLKALIESQTTSFKALEA